MENTSNSHKVNENKKESQLELQLSLSDAIYARPGDFRRIPFFTEDELKTPFIKLDLNSKFFDILDCAINDDGDDGISYVSFNNYYKWCVINYSIYKKLFGVVINDEPRIEHSLTFSVDKNYGKRLVFELKDDSEILFSSDVLYDRDTVKLVWSLDNVSVSSSSILIAKLGGSLADKAKHYVSNIKAKLGDELQIKTLSILQAMYDENIDNLNKVIPYSIRDAYNFGGSLKSDNTYILHDRAIMDPFSFINCNIVVIVHYALDYSRIKIKKDVFKKIIKYWIDKAKEDGWLEKETGAKFYRFNTYNILSTIHKLNLKDEVEVAFFN